MPQEIGESRRGTPARRVAAIKAKIVGMDLVCSGSLIERTKTCGKPNCQCATDPEARHGPYHEWSRREAGRLVHKIVTPAQARALTKAIANHREIERLLARWERETTSIILQGDPPKT